MQEIKSPYNPPKRIWVCKVVKNGRGVAIHIPSWLKRHLQLFPDQWMVLTVEQEGIFSLRKLDLAEVIRRERTDNLYGENLSPKP